MRTPQQASLHAHAHAQSHAQRSTVSFSVCAVWRIEPRRAVRRAAAAAETDRGERRGRGRGCGCGVLSPALAARCCMVRCPCWRRVSECAVGRGEIERRRWQCSACRLASAQSHCQLHRLTDAPSTPQHGAAAHAANTRRNTCTRCTRRTEPRRVTGRHTGTRTHKHTRKAGENNTTTDTQTPLPRVRTLVLSFCGVCCGWLLLRSNRLCLTQQQTRHMRKIPLSQVIWDTR
jgi:hypothetical protein